MKKLLKSEICESRELFMEPTNMLKIAEKSKFSTTIYAQYMNSSFCLQLRVKKKKKKKKKRRRGKRRRHNNLNPIGHIYICF